MMLSVSAYAALLKQKRGITVSSITIRGWCQRGLLPGAQRDARGRWHIPDELVDSFELPRDGRPRNTPAEYDAPLLLLDLVLYGPQRLLDIRSAARLGWSRLRRGRALRWLVDRGIVIAVRGPQNHALYQVL